LLPDEAVQRATPSDEPGSRKPPAVFCPAAEHTETRTIASDMKVERIIHSPVTNSLTIRRLAGLLGSCCTGNNITGG